MKKTLVIFLAVVSIFLCSCGSAEPAEANMADAEMAQTTEQKISEIPMQTSVAGGSYVTERSAAKAKDGFHYFSFVQDTVTHTDENDNVLLLETLTQADFYSTDPELSGWVNGFVDELYASDVAYGQDLLGYAGENLKAVGEEQFYSYSHYVSMGVGRHDSEVISLLSLSSVYSGGSHPSSVRTAHNLDITQMRILTLEDVIDPTGIPELTELVRTNVESKFAAMGEGALYDDYADTIADSLTYGNMTPHWYFSEDGLVVFFNQYTLGPYASGLIRAEVSYEELDGILLPEYFPKDYSGTVADIKLTQKPDEDKWVYDVELAEGTTIYFSIEGDAHHVQFSEVYWADQTPVGESMLFSANHVDDSTTVAITGDFLDTSKVYAVEYYDEDGGPNIIYIQGTEILDELPVKQ